MQERFLKCQQKLVDHRQQHLLRFWDELTDEQREELLNTIESISWGLITRLIETYAKAKPEAACPTPLEPAPAYRKAELQKSQDSTFQQAGKIGDQLLQNGQVAAFTVAGGQGTRLGFDGPKGAMAVSPIKKKSFFQLFAEMLKAVQISHGRALPWYIMTSSANHLQTTDFFSANGYFGLNPKDVVFFSQAMLPSFDSNGNLLLASKYQLALSPDGHGGSLKALYDHGALRDMNDRGIKLISYFQVDNPLVRPFDPLFLGLHAMTGSEMSTKVTAKTSDQERVGNLCMHHGRQIVVEYGDSQKSRWQPQV
jgi:UDP-N-acetylglucosamine/UDP-N-acetylgalactosamine diphosphorylase